MDIRLLLRKIWIMILLATIGGVAAKYMFEQKAITMYEAECTLYVFNIDKAIQKGQTLTQSDLSFSITLVQNFSELIKSRRVTSQAIQILSKNGVTGVNDEMLIGMVSLGTQKQSNIVVISAKSTDPEFATMVSNAMGKAFVDTLNALTNSKTIDILDPALIPKTPIPSNTQSKILAGVLFGLLLGFGIIYLQQLFDNTVHSAEDIEKQLNLPIIGIIPENNIK